MDNQQETQEKLAERLTLAEIGWLAGIIDGEGSFYMYPTFAEGKKQKYRRFAVGFGVSNTDEGLILKVAELCDKIDSKLRIKEYKSKSVKKKKYWKAETQTMAKVRRIIKVTLPYLTCKQVRAKLLLRFIDSRLANWKRYGAAKGRRCHYTEEEICLAEEIVRLNGRGSSEAIRPALAETR